MKLAGRVAHVGMRNACKISVKKLGNKRHSEDLCVYGRIILEWI